MTPPPQKKNNKKKTEIGQFQKIVGGLIELVDELAKEAENEKMKVCSCILNEYWCICVLCSFILLLLLFYRL